MKIFVQLLLIACSSLSWNFSISYDIWYANVRDNRILYFLIASRNNVLTIHVDPFDTSYDTSKITIFPIPRNILFETMRIILRNLRGT